MWTDKWIVFAACSMRLFFFSGCMKSNGVMLDEIVHQLNSTHTLVAWAFAIQNGLACMFTPVAKLLCKVFTFRQMAVGGGFLAGFGYVYCGLYVTSAWQLYIAFSVSGIGFALSVIPGYVMLEDYFREKFSTAMSASSLCNFVGIALLPPLLQYLKTVFGSREALVLFGAITWNLIAAGFGLKERSHSCSERDDTPNNRSRHAKTKRKFKFVDKYLFFCSSLFYHKNYAVLVFTEFLSSFIYISWALFLVSLGTNAGLEEKAVILSTAGGVGAFFGTIGAVGLFHYQKMNAYTSCSIPLFINGFCFVGLTIAKDFTLLLALAFLTGVCLGLNLSGMMGLIPSLTCRCHFEEAVVINYFIDGIAFQFGGLISGAIRDGFGSTVYVYGFNALLSFFAVPWIFIWACNKDPNQECEPDIDE